jgi:hypothetical protein
VKSVHPVKIPPENLRNEDDLFSLRAILSSGEDAIKRNSYVEHVCNSGTTLWNSGKQYGYLIQNYTLIIKSWLIEMFQ